MTDFSITALDALMFRDGRPFNQGDEGTDAAVSRFPPPPPTIAGALRLLFADHLGFGPGKSWPVAKLGDGVNWQADDNQLGPLRFSAALLSSVADGLLYPCPLHLAKANEQAVIDLLPRETLDCDLGREVILPAAERTMTGAKSYAGDWLTHEGMQTVLEGELPDKKQIIANAELYQFESRVGIGRDSETRRVLDGALYTAQFVRMADDVSLVVNVEGLEPKAARAQGLQRFGGEHRSAFIQPLAGAVTLPSAPKSLRNKDGKFRYAAISLAPVVFENMPMPGGSVEGLQGTLVSACIGKPQMIGGWDSQNRTPLPMRPALPAGSVFFMETENEASALSCHGKSIGSFGAWGFGQALIAKWERQ